MKAALDALKSAESAAVKENADLKTRLSQALISAEQSDAELKAALDRDAQLTGRPFERRPRKSPLDRKLRIAGMMDEFTTACFALECEFLPLDPARWHDQLIDFAPDVVFIESAWHGNGGLWHLKVSSVSTELEGVLRWCKVSGTPSILWNKEDPVHFSAFLDVAARVNVVFTTDIDCIPAYKHHLGHDRVYVLPFAAQPAIHNPVEVYDRKDAFNFAGSYYLRYPQRQRDIRTLIDTLAELKPVEIYDRNFEKGHPHYKYPDEYKSLILGSLPFSEIDKAYKGYNYGINMNTIKQSQTMFARRVFELMASNTVVVSNFSRGVRMLFGDLVICSDNADQIKARLAPIVDDGTHYRKFRLQALRKVMSEHTYRSRLTYVMSKVVSDYVPRETPRIAVLAVARDAAARDYLLKLWKSQTFDQGHLFLLCSDRPDDAEFGSDVSVFAEADMLTAALSEHSAEFVGLMSAADHYGPNYLTDLALAERYSAADGFGKVAHFAKTEDGIALHAADAAYRPAQAIELRAGILRRTLLSDALLAKCLSEPESAAISGQPVLALDEFNYCRNATTVEASQITDDAASRSRGISLDEIWDTAEGLPAGLPRPHPGTRDLPSITVRQLPSYIATAHSEPVSVTTTPSRLVVTSKLQSGKYKYLWTKRKFPRDEINLVDDSKISFDLESTAQECHFVCEFYDAQDQKISHSMLTKGGTHSLALPNECTNVRFGTRVSGQGIVEISGLSFGTPGDVPPVVFGRSDTLVLTQQYPAYDDVYRYGFLHNRLRGYCQAGLETDIFRLNVRTPRTYDELESFDIASGDAILLDATLATGRYKHALVHFLDARMWRVLSNTWTRSA
ncbi:methyltransferase type 12 [Rhodobacteraceae bacterium CCMM004]|nr:methyltransferase type 12 [Rhodobacteraceae bacterium CCMM004]